MTLAQRQPSRFTYHLTEASMFLPSLRMISVFALALLGVSLTAGSSLAQQGWPYNPDRRGGGSPSRFIQGVSPSYAVTAAPVATAQFHVQVPADARVWFDGQPTVQTGAAREFVSSPLVQGVEYSYVVRVAWRQGDRLIEQNRSITFKTGDHVNLDFTGPAVTASR